MQERTYAVKCPHCGTKRIVREANTSKLIKCYHCNLEAPFKYWIILGTYLEGIPEEVD
ncbi:MAG: hypothetical protein J7K29_03000 [Candidatus Cloacimonetes bacterium]|nr:hypothetical protein [Candidatus Cloacimonadota bacterium]